MPRIRPLSETAKDREAFNRIMDIKRAEAGIATWTDLADKLGVDRNTFYSWRRDPGRIPRRKLRELYRLLRYTPEDMFASFGFGRSA